MNPIRNLCTLAVAIAALSGAAVTTGAQGPDLSKAEIVTKQVAVRGAQEQYHTLGEQEVPMSEQQNLEVVRKGYEAFGRGDINALLSLFDQNIEWVSPGPPELPTAGTRRGLQAVGEFFKTLNELLEFTRFDARDFVAQGDRVIVLGDDAARVKATGKVLEGAWAHVFTLKNGKVVSFQEYSDMSPMVAELRAAAARA